MIQFGLIHLLMGAYKNQSSPIIRGLGVQPHPPASGLSDPGVVADQNAAVLKWVPKVRAALRSSARWFSDGKTESMVIRDHGKQLEKKLANSIDSKFRKDFNVINNISFQFERHGVFVHKGVGRGYQSNGNGFVTRTAKYPARIRERVAVEWFNPVLDKNVPALADQIAEINTEAAINATNMRIK